MRVYSIEELDSSITEKLVSRLEHMGFSSGLERLYWIPLTEDQMTPVQREHTDSCGPHVMALEVREDSVRLELLVRAKNSMHCECVSYASPETEHAMIDQLNHFVALIQNEELDGFFGVLC